MAIEHGDTWQLWGLTQARIFVPHGILLFQFRIHGKHNVLGQVRKLMHFSILNHRSNFELNVTYMGEEESNGSFLDTWARFTNIYDIYDTNDEDDMKFMTYFRPERLNLTIMTCHA